jgi:acyl carrier protein
MTEAEILDVICEALEVDAGSVSSDARIEDVPDWTSLAWLALMSLVDERWEVQLHAKEIRGFKTVRDVIDTLLARQA